MRSQKALWTTKISIVKEVRTKYNSERVKLNKIDKETKVIIK